MSTATDNATPVPAAPGWPLDWQPPVPDLAPLVTDNDDPLDSTFSEKQMRLLVEPLYAGWRPPGNRPFWATANVGLFGVPRNPAMVPDVLVSLDVQPPPDLHVKAGHSYYLWEAGKPPDIVIEIVSNRRGGEADRKLVDYARMRVTYYVIFDPEHHVQEDDLRTFALHRGSYQPLAEPRFEDCGLSLVRWRGRFEEREEHWLRWADERGGLIPTGVEQAEAERARAEAARARADRADSEAEALRAQAEALRRQLAELTARLGERENDRPEA